MKSFTSIVGWLLLVALIAVPSFLFYNWMSSTKNGESAAMSQTQNLPAGPLFQSADKSGTSRPADGETSQAPGHGWAQPPGGPAAQPQKADPAPQSQQKQPAAHSAPDPAPAPAPARLQDPTPAAAAPQAAASAAQPSDPQPRTAVQAAVGVSTQAKLVSYFNPKTERDPTMSPDDYQKIKDEEQRRREEEENEKQRELDRIRKNDPTARLKLQGIVGDQVIINGDMYSVGRSVMGIKILKIGPDYIIGEYKGKKLKKVLQ